MPGEYAPSRMTEHVLNHPKGWFDGHALDHKAKVSANVTFSIPQGRVAHLNEDGEFEMGISTTKMAIFLLQGSNQPSVINPSHTASGRFVQSPAFPNGVMSGLVATGGFELESSEFEAAAANGYAPNTLLTAWASNTVLARGGVLSSDRAHDSDGAVRQYVDAACACVSRGVIQTEHGTSVVCFWPVYMPAAAA